MTQPDDNIELTRLLGCLVLAALLVLVGITAGIYSILAY